MPYLDECPESDPLWWLRLEWLEAHPATLNELMDKGVKVLEKHLAKRTEQARLQQLQMENRGVDPLDAEAEVRKDLAPETEPELGRLSRANAVKLKRFKALKQGLA